MTKLEAISLYAYVIGFSSTVFMVWTFINEAFFGHGVYFYEPNRPLAAGEFTAALAGLLVLGFLMFSTALYSAKANKQPTEPYGHGKVKKGVYV